MARPKSALPQMRVHLSGQGFVRIGDRNFYLGKYGSPESLARYAILIAEYQANQLRLPEDFDVRDIDERAGLLLSKEVELPPEGATNGAIHIHIVSIPGAVGEFAAQGRFDSKDRVSFCLGIDIVKNWHPIPN